MKTNTRDRNRNYTERRHLLSLAATMAAVFFLMPGIQLPAGTDGVTVEPVACVGGNFKSFGGALGKNRCLKRLVVPGLEGGEAPDPVALPASKGRHKAHEHRHRHEGKGHHKGKGKGHHKGKGKGHHKGKSHEHDKGKVGGRPGGKKGGKKGGKEGGKKLKD